MNKDRKLGIALYVSRRFINLYNFAEKKYLHGTTDSRHLEVAPGDYVYYTEDNTDSNVAINEVLPRKNLLKRSYDKKVKNLAANIEELWIVTAPPPLFNALAIDRTITAAQAEDIKVKIIANKSDLDTFGSFYTDLHYYNKVISEVICTSAHKKSGLDKLGLNTENTDPAEACKIIAISGVSGVGKSSLINYINPHAQADHGVVSNKTGQGKQTTSAAQGYVIESKNTSQTTILVDLPGIQNYGISHLSLDQIVAAMVDLHEFSVHCKFRDCKHLKEPQCAVQEALKNKELEQSRFESYLDMKQEVEKIKSY